MTRMTGPDCAVMCKLINIHTYIHTVDGGMIVAGSEGRSLEHFWCHPIPLSSSSLETNQMRRKQHGRIIKMEGKSFNGFSVPYRKVCFFASQDPSSST